LPDAATAQAHLRAGFYCTHAGNYYGFGTNSTPGSGRVLTLSFFPDGSLRSISRASYTPAWFDVQTGSATILSHFG